MPFKINIGTKSGKTYKLETEELSLSGKKLGDKISGQEISPDLAGYEFEITGASDKSGFASLKEVEGVNIKRVLLSYGKAMKTRPRKEGKKKQLCKKPKGLRLRKTVRGNEISEFNSQINLKLVKEGSKKLEEVFTEQTQPKEKENRKTKRAKAQAEAKAQKDAPVEEPVKEEKSE